jgi:phage terminase large subunit GpA-like protein
MRERNEALDCRIYARAAAWITGVDRWTEAMWRDLERQASVSVDVEGEQAMQPNTINVNDFAGVLRRRREPRSRRVFQSSYMS